MNTLILHIETATDVCSVALSESGKLLKEIINTDERSHGSQLTLMMQELCKQAGVKFDQLDALSISKGPGSYTGLRIGAATAKGFCFALNKPLIAINTFDSFVQTFSEQQKNLLESLSGSFLFCPMIDARRMEVYYSLHRSDKSMLTETKAEVITQNSFAQELNDHKIIFFGSGAMKCKALLQQLSNAIFVDNFFPFAAGQRSLAYDLFLQKKFENIVYFEPFYLKEFLGRH